MNPAVFLYLLLALNPDERFFDKRVAPILTRRCLPCHNRELKNGGISFLDRDTLLNGAVVPGKPDESALVGALRHDGEVQMPPGRKLPPKQIAILKEWIERGAVCGSKLR